MADIFDAPEFVDADVKLLLAEARAYYEGLAGKTLQEGQNETLLLKTFTYYRKLDLDKFNHGAAMQLIDFATGPMLDYLAALMGVTRLTAEAAVTTMQYSIVQGHTGVVIPQGHRVQSTDGKAVFVTKAQKVVAIGVYTVDVDAECQVAGLIGNDYQVGDVNDILDPLVFVVSASNSDLTSGGADAETDDQLRERTKISTNKSSGGATKGYYRYWTLTAHPSIVSVEVLNKNDDISIPGGTVKIYPLVKGGGTTPAGVIDAVEAIFTDDEVRGLNDTILVESPTAVNYDITVALTLFNGTNATDTINNVSQILNDFAQGLKGKLGLDVTLDRLTAYCMLDGVYDVNITLPAADVVVTKTQFANIGTIQVTVSGFTNG